MADRVELITYADRLGGTLPGLHEVLSGPLAGPFGGVHIPPLLHPVRRGDAGFDPADHTEVDPRLGSWDDIAALARDFDVMVDVIVNHVSSTSPPFLDWLAKGSASVYDGMFLTSGGAFPDDATEEVLMRLYRPRPGLPFTPYQLGAGNKRLIWTTFTSQQIDVHVRHPVTRAYLAAVLDKLAASSVRRVRLDAVGYAVKTPGLTSFMTPETFRFIDDIDQWCSERNLEVGRGCDRPIPTGTADARADRPAGRGDPRQQRRRLAAADGRGGLERRSLSGQLHLLRRPGPRGQPLPARPGAAAVDARHPADLLRRAARRRERHGPAGRSRVGRDVNRHYYTPTEIAAEIQRPVVDGLFRLIRFRNSHPSFDGEFAVSGSGAQLQMSWTAGEDSAVLDADLAAGTATVSWSGPRGPQQASLTDLP